MTFLPLEEIQQAHTRIQGRIATSPLINLGLSQAGHAIYVKPEHLQPTGSFKIRGATNAIAQLSDAQRQRGVIAYSTGNHAQAVALAAKTAGAAATIVMSPDVPEHKVEKTQSLGARVLMAETSSEARRRLAEQHATTEGLALIPPYDHPAVMAGQATIGLEILNEMLPAMVYVPVGGGGLIAGIAAAIKQQEPSVRIIGVEPREELDTFESLIAGRRIGLPGPSSSIADAIKVQIPGENTFPLMQRYVDDIVLVDDSQIVEAMRQYFSKTGYRLEPAGAAALAAVLASTDAVGTAGKIVCIGTGQNVTEDRFQQLVDAK
ncbi:threonine ammonia-lyase [Bradyrhizobium sp. 5.13L]